MKTLTTIQKLKTAICAFLTTLTMALLITACTSTGYDSGGSSSSTSSGNGCNDPSRPCNSNGYCCPRGYVGCEGNCYTSVGAAYGATLNASCNSVTTTGC